MKRREAITGMIGGGLGALTPSALHAERPVHGHPAGPAAVDPARPAAEAGSWAPAFLSAHQSATLEAVAEHLVPRSTEAGVHRFVDKLLAIETQATQRRFLESLSAFEATSLQQSGKPFLALSAAERDAVLDTLSARPAPPPDPASQAPGSPLRGAEPLPVSHFTNVKTWVSRAFYSSEIGMRELGWTGNSFFGAFPGCTHPGGHD
jgi:hypothetical protein